MKPLARGLIGLVWVLVGVVLVAQSPRTELSKKAMALNTGMTRTAVLTRLGAPTWVILPGDGGPFALPDLVFRMEWRWRNAPCLNVAVSFNSQMLVSGIDAGNICIGSVKNEEPSAAFACTRPDRVKHCRPMTQ